MKRTKSDEWGRNRVTKEHREQAARILGIDPNTPLENPERLPKRSTYTWADSEIAMEAAQRFSTSYELELDHPRPQAIRAAELLKESSEKADKEIAEMLRLRKATPHKGPAR